MLQREKVGQRIALYRKKKNMTQKQLANLLHVSYQAVSKWESGGSLPSVDMLYDISVVLEVTVDALLSGMTKKEIDYRDTGLDTSQLYFCKEQLQELVTTHDDLLYAHYRDPVFFQIDTSAMKDPVYVMATNVPGSKEKLAKERGYDKEICFDVTARAINNLVRFGVTPIVLQAHMVCGNRNLDSLMSMGEGFKTACETNHIHFAGLEISAQPVNYLPNEYELSVSIVGAADRCQILTGEQIQEGDIAIGITTDGIDSTSFPFIKVMLERNPYLAYRTIDKQQSFIDGIMKPNAAYAHDIAALQKCGILHGTFRISNYLLNWDIYNAIPENLGLCLHMSQIRVPPLFQFIGDSGLISRKTIPYRFAFGIGMIVIVPKAHAEQALSIIQSYHDCYIIGKIERKTNHSNPKVWAKGEIQW